MPRFFLAGILAIGFIPSSHAVESEEVLARRIAGLFDGVHEVTLPNGLHVYLKSIPGAATVTTMVAYRVGSSDEELDHTGLSHYLEHLMFKGTEKLKPGDIDRLTQRNGGRNNAYTSEDMTVFHFDFAADRWPAALEIEEDRMQNLRIDKRHEFEEEKGAVISELDGDEDQPWDLEQKLILPILFGAKTPYGHPVIGVKEHVHDATAAVIKSHYDLWYHPNNASLVIVGGFDEKEALEKIHKLFGPIPRAELPKRKPIPEVPGRKETVRIVMKSKFETPRLLIGFNGVVSGDPDESALDILQTALTTGKTSRLYHRLVDEDKLAVSVNATDMTGRYPGWFSFQIELFNEEYEKVEGIISKEVRKIAEEGISDAELKRVKRILMASYLFSHESVHDMADAIARSVSTNDLAYLQRYLTKIAAVTSDDLKRVAKKYLVDAKGVVIRSKPDAKAGGAPDGKQGKAGPGRKDDAGNGPGWMSLENSKKVKLDNGLTLLLLEDHRLPMIVARTAVRQVHLREPADKLGIATLMGMLLDAGTKTRKEDEIATAIDNTGGDLSLASTGGTLKVLTPDTDLGLDLLFDCMIHPEFPMEELEARRDQLLSEITEQEAQPEHKASLEYHHRVYGSHPLGRSSLGTEKTVKELKREDLKEFHAQLFVPNNTTIAVVGDFDSEKLIKGIKKRTADWKAVSLPALKLPEISKPPKKEEVILSEPEAAQVHVYMGHVGVRRDNPDYFKLLVLDNVLGTGPGFTDRLSSTLRDRQGLAYTVRATISADPTEEPGTFTGYLGTFPSKYITARDGMLKEIKRIREEVPKKEEVEDAKQYLLGSLPFKLTTREEAADLLLNVERYGLGKKYLDDYRKGVAAVTPEDVQMMAKKYIDPDKMVIVAAGPIDKDGKALEKKGPPAKE